METVIRSVVIAHGNLANQNISGSGHNCKAVILMGPQSDTLSRFYLNLCASRYIVKREAWKRCKPLKADWKAWSSAKC